MSTQKKRKSSSNAVASTASTNVFGSLKVDSDIDDDDGPSTKQVTIVRYTAVTSDPISCTASTYGDILDEVSATLETDKAKVCIFILLGITPNVKGRDHLQMLILEPVGALNHAQVPDDTQVVVGVLPRAQDPIHQMSTSLRSVLQGLEQDRIERERERAERKMCDEISYARTLTYELLMYINKKHAELSGIPNATKVYHNSKTVLVQGATVTADQKILDIIEQDATRFFGSVGNFVTVVKSLSSDRGVLAHRVPLAYAEFSAFERIVTMSTTESASRYFQRSLDFLRLAIHLHGGRPANLVDILGADCFR